MLIISFILMTIMFDSRVILWGVKGLKKKNREILLHVRPYLGMPFKMSNYFHSFPIGQCRWVPCRESFLFSLVNPHGLGPIKIAEIKSRENAIFCNNNCDQHSVAGTTFKYQEMRTRPILITVTSLAQSIFSLTLTCL